MMLFAFQGSDGGPTNHLLDPAHRQLTAGELTARVLVLLGEWQQSLSAVAPQLT